MAPNILPCLNVEAIGSIHRELMEQGYSIMDARALGTTDEHREHIHEKYFNDTILRSYQGDQPADRKRARDVVRYDWHGDVLDVCEYPEIAIENRGGHPGRREFIRTELLGDQIFKHWICTAISLIPPKRRQSSGTFGINLFRTHTNVVTKPHRDGEQFVFLYVVAKVGGGGQTRLYRLDSDEVVLSHTLKPGELIVFEDGRFRHDAGPLTPPAGGKAQRDVLVCTINYPSTYPLPAVNIRQPDGQPEHPSISETA